MRWRLGWTTKRDPASKQEKNNRTHPQNYKHCHIYKVSPCHTHTQLKYFYFSIFCKAFHKLSIPWITQSVSFWGMPMSCCYTQGCYGNCLDLGVQVFLYEVSQTRFARINIQFLFLLRSNWTHTQLCQWKLPLKNSIFISGKLMGRQFYLCFYESFPAAYSLATSSS